MAQGVTLIVLVLSCFFAAVFAARGCYLCNSYSDIDHTACVDPMSPYPAVNYTYCPDNYVCTRVSYITQKHYVVSRGCDLSGDTCNNIYRNLSVYYADIASFNCYTCTAMSCNDASGLSYFAELKEMENMEIQEPVVSENN